MIRVLNPTQDAVAAEAKGPAPTRLEDLAGTTVGLFHNDKLRAGDLLELIGEILVAEHGVASVVRGWYDTGRPMRPEQWIGIDQCDFVVLGLGDCGSCSSSGIVNSLQVEATGRPAVLVSTPPFAHVCQTMSELSGRPDYQWATVEHPIGSVSQSEFQARAESAAQQVVAIVAAKTPALSAR